VHSSFLSICVYFVFFFFHTAYVLYNCECSGVDLMRLKPSPWTLSFFSAVTLLVGSFDPQKPVPDMTCNVFDGMLNCALLKTCFAMLSSL